MKKRRLPLDFFAELDYIDNDCEERMLKTLKRVVFVGLLSLSLTSCDLFRTRSVEPPLDTGTPWIPPTQQTDQVFQNMIQAVAELNSNNYLLSFFSPDNSDIPFLFVPNPSVVGWPLSEPWEYADEKKTFEYLISLTTPDSSGYLYFSEETRLVYGNEDSVWVRQAYTLVVPTVDPNLPTDVSGKSDFYLAKTDIGYWAIYRWEDIEGSPSWTDLKAALY